jgi:uncharacterized OsmC-like protein
MAKKKTKDDFKKSADKKPAAKKIKKTKKAEKDGPTGPVYRPYEYGLLGRGGCCVPPRRR